MLFARPQTQISEPKNIVLAYAREADGSPKYYKPHPHQIALHEQRGRVFLRALITGYGGGKTLWGCAEAAQLCSTYPGFRFLDVSPSYQQARRTTIETYGALFDASGIRTRYNKTEHEYKFQNGSIIWIGSGDNPDSLKGTNLNHARLDEPFIQERAVYDQVIARLRLTNGPAGLLLTGTPESLNWGHDLLFGEHQEKGKFTRAILQVSSLCNTSLTQQYFDNLYANYDERMIAAYIDGQFVSLDTKQAYYQFDSTLHCGPLTYDPLLPLYFTLDFNVEPFCACIIQQHGEVDWVIDEIHIQRNGTTERACDEFLARYKEHKAGVIVTGDPAGTARNTQSIYGGYNNFSIVKDKLGALAGFQLKVPPSIVPIINSLNLTNARLKNSKGQVRVKVDSKKCRFTIQDFERVMRSNDNKIDKLADGSISHHSDAIRMYHFQFRRGAGYGGAS